LPITLYRVIEAIVQEQVAFFEKGISYLMPMNLKLVAEISKGFKFPEEL